MTNRHGQIYRGMFDYLRIRSKLLYFAVGLFDTSLNISTPVGPSAFLWLVPPFLSRFLVSLRANCHRQEEGWDTLDHKDFVLLSPEYQLCRQLGDMQFTFFFYLLSFLVHLPTLHIVESSRAPLKEADDSISGHLYSAAFLPVVFRCYMPWILQSAHVVWNSVSDRSFRLNIWAQVGNV